MPPITRATSRATRSSRSRSLPKTLTTTDAVYPDRISSIRSVRNGLRTKLTPGNWISALRNSACASSISSPDKPALRATFAVMRAPGILRLLGPPDTLCDRAHHRQLGQRSGHEPSEPLRLGDGSARHRRHMEGEVALLEFGQERSSEERQESAASQSDEGGDGNGALRARDDAAQQVLVMSACPIHDGRAPVMHDSAVALASLVGKQDHAKCRRDRQRDEERSENCQDVGKSERSEQPSGDAGQCNDGQEHQDDGKARIDDGAAYFQGSVEDDAGGRTGARILPVLAQPADDVLNVDHGIIDHLADRDCESAQSHGVECYAERRQDDHGGKKRKRIAVQQIAAVRRSNRKRNRTMTTRMPPRNKESRTLVVAVSMKSAGRKRSA